MTTPSSNGRQHVESAPSTEGSPWSVWGIRLAAVLSVALAIALLWAWIETFYRGVAINAQLLVTRLPTYRRPMVIRFTTP